MVKAENVGTSKLAMNTADQFLFAKMLEENKKMQYQG